MSFPLSRFQEWLDLEVHFRGAVAIGAHRFDGGASNLTCRVDLRGWTEPAVVVRVQRERGIFEPYDVLREARVHQALQGSRVPVPAVYAVEPDAAVLGAPFAVFQWVDAPHMGEAGEEADFGAFVAMVAEIHRVDWRAQGLEFLGVPPDSARATLSELDAIERRLHAFGLGRDRKLLDALELLRAAAPDGRLAFCQGDINVFNYLFRDRKVVAVVDWEQAHIGDPRSDLGQLVTLSHLKGAPLGPAGAMPFVRAYSAAAGRPVTGVGYFRALWLVQLAVIHAGWVQFNGSEPWFTRARIDELLGPALEDLD